MSKIEENVYKNLLELFSFPQYCFRKQKIITSENVTAGKIGSSLYEVPSMKRFYSIGIIEQSGNIMSKNTAIAMSKKALEKYGVDIAVSISGVIGQYQNGQPDIGIAYISISTKRETVTKKIKTSLSDKEGTIELFSEATLNYLNQFLESKIKQSINGFIAI